MSAVGLENWRRLVLPLSVIVIVFACAMFSYLAITKYDRLEAGISGAEASFSYQGLRDDLTSKDILEGANGELRTRSILEAYVQSQRYSMARTLAGARIWMKFMAFVTGMIMALIGSAFILNRLTEKVTQFAAEAKDIKASLSSASPGVILASLGTVLMAMAVGIGGTIEVSDRTLYFSSNASSLPDSSQADPQKVGEDHTPSDKKGSLSVRKIIDSGGFRGPAGEPIEVAGSEDQSPQPNPDDSMLMLDALKDLDSGVNGVVDKPVKPVCTPDECPA